MKVKKELESVEKEFDKQKGIFQTEFHKVLDKMNLKQRVYHSGSLVGNDLNKLTKSQNIRHISNIFKPKRIDMKKGKKLFSSHRLKVKIITLLGKFRQCHDLYPVAGLALFQLRIMASHKFP